MSKILVADDEGGSRELLARLLRDCGHDILEASNGQVALELARRELPDLVLSDVLMPWMDGFELLRQLRADPATASIPVILLTGAFAVGEADALARAGGDVPLLRKPYRLDEFRRTVAAALAAGPRLPASSPMTEEFDRDHRHLFADKLVQKVAEAEHAVEALRGSEERYRALSAHSHDGIALFGADGAVLYASPSTTRLMGWLPEELLGHTMMEFVRPDSQDAFRAQVAEALRRPGVGIPSEGYVQHKDGEYRFLEGTVCNLLAEPNVGAIVINFRDSTDRKRADNALREAWRFSQSTIDALSAHLCVLGEDGVILATNQAWRDFAEANSPMAQREGPGVNYLEVCDRVTGPEAADAAVFAAGIRAVIGRELDYFSMEYPCHSPAEQRWFAARVTRFGGDGETCAVVVHENITERKLAEEKLQASEVRYRRLFESAKDGILILDAATGMVVDVNPFLIERLGFSREALLAKKVWELGFLKDLIANEANFSELQQKEYMRYEDLALETSDGRRIEVEFVSNVYLVNGRKVIQCNIRDITARVRAEKALREAEARLRLAVAASNVGLWDWNLATNEVFFSREWKSQLGYAEDEIPNRLEEWESRVHPEDLAPTLAKVRAFIEDPAGEYAVEFRLRHKDGSWRWISTRGQLVRDAAGQPARMLGCHIDITDRKQAEAESERRLRELQLILDSVPALVFYKDRESRFLRVNRELSRLLGVPPEAFIGRTDADMGSAEAAHYRADDLRVMESGEPIRHVEERIHTADGPRWLLTDKFAHRDEAGRIYGLIGFSVDITERKHAEDALRRSGEELRALARHIESIREEQAARIAQELHDELGQMLTILKLHLRSLQRKRTVHTGESSTLESREAEELIEGAIRSVRQLCTELRPPVLDHLGLHAALEALAADFRTRSGIDYTFSATVDFPVLDTSRQTTVYRIVQELLTNVARHAGASEVRIALRVQGAGLEVEVADNGRGFVPEEMAGKGSLGLLGMRERALAAGGSFTIEGTPGHGTTAVARLPLGPPVKTP